ncbi:hypothetical protein SMA90_27725, partial [Escherichia coli]
MGLREGICVLYGAEITTREEVHCLAYVETEEQREKLQEFLDTYLPRIPNEPEIFGYQFWVDENEQVLGEAPYLLISAIDRSIDQTAAFVRSIGGLFVPAHIERPRNSLLSQLGFVPAGLPADALELSRFSDPETFLQKNPYLDSYMIIQSSDAHYPDD